MTTQSYVVRGMTCEHCVASVTEEVSRIDSVDDVSIDLDSGQVTVTSSTPVSAEAVAAAVAEAGYEVASQQ